MHYVDGFLLNVKTDQLDDYKEIASMAGEIWMDHGAIGYYECKADDVALMDGMQTSFADMAKPADDETMFFSFIIFPSKEARDEINKKVMADPRMNDPSMKDKPMPFDMKKMAYGGFLPVVSLVSDKA